MQDKRRQADEHRTLHVRRNAAADGKMAEGGGRGAFSSFFRAMVGADLQNPFGWNYFVDMHMSDSMLNALVM